MNFLYTALSYISACESGFKQAANQRLHVEFSLLKLCFINAKPDASQQSLSSKPAPSPAAASAPVAAPAALAPQATAAPAAPATPQASVAPETPAAPATPAAPQAAQTSTPPQAAALAAEGHAGSAAAQPSAEPGHARQRRLATASSHSLSLSSMMKEEESHTVTNESEDQRKALPEEAEVEKAWKDIIAMCQASPVSNRLAGIFANAPYTISLQDDNMVLHIKVDNENTKKWLEDKFLSRMQAKMQQALETSRFRLLVELIPMEEAREFIYLPQDKAKKIISEHPEVGNLVVDLGLDS